ncbi:DUF4445 domain-containing protein [Halomonas sp. ZH2S]|uniref:DUF4445 domain-containing protein n=1 Tax=Vreelandella zhuhanensis TaxID=2684210 RepID=A0A7X3KR13_9GAMM|nr:ASKHA domain-containing protein [Halomonas zhuhanensis]MWJ29070.1 DUF4445 domain-containing protein [Halomonas zhuhanensis]
MPAIACSCPTGPAFEGAQISGGQRATSGAIDPLTLEPRYKVIGGERWSDEPGFEEEVAPYGVTGICGSGIIEVIAEMYLAGIINQDGVVQGGPAAHSERVVADGRTFSYVLHHEGERTLAITQADIRAIQLAKAALYAGIRLLMEHFVAVMAIPHRHDAFPLLSEHIALPATTERDPAPGRGPGRRRRRTQAINPS